MEFEWDNQKNNANIAKHGIDFEFAKEIFSGIWISKPDNRKNYDESRFLLLGVWMSLLSLLFIPCEGRKYVLSL